MKNIEILGLGRCENRGENFPEIPEIEIMTIEKFTERTILTGGNTEDSIWFLAKSLEQFETFNEYFKRFMDIGTFKGYYEWLIDIIQQIDKAIVIYKKDKIVYILAEKRNEFASFSFVVRRNIEMIEFSLGMDRILETAQLLEIDQLKTGQIDKITEIFLIFAERVDKFHNQQVREFRESLDRWTKSKREV